MASYSAFLLRAVEVMETAKLEAADGIRVAMAPIAFGTLSDSLVGGTATSDFDRLKASFNRLVISNQVSERGARDDTDKGASTVFFGAGDANSFLTMWGNPEQIVDPYSESKTGKIALTIFSFVDTIIQRTGTHYFKLTGLQDRI